MTNATQAPVLAGPQVDLRALVETTHEYVRHLESALDALDRGAFVEVDDALFNASTVRMSIDLAGVPVGLDLTAMITALALLDRERMSPFERARVINVARDGLRASLAKAREMHSRLAARAQEK